MSQVDQPVRVDEAEVRRLYRLVLEIQAKVRDLENHAHTQDELKWAQKRRESVDIQHGRDLRFLRAGDGESMSPIFHSAAMNARPLDEAPLGFWDHIDAEVRPQLKQLTQGRRDLTHPWFDWEDGRGTLRPEVAVQLEPIMTAIAADVDAGRWP